MPLFDAKSRLKLPAKMEFDTYKRSQYFEILEGKKEKTEQEPKKKTNKKGKE